MPFPGTVAGLQVYVEFSGLHNGDDHAWPSAAAAAASRARTTCRSRPTPTGTFTVTAPALCRKASSTSWPWSSARPTSRRCRACRRRYTDAFRIDKTAPQITGASFTPGGADPAPAQRAGCPTSPHVASLTHPVR